MYALAPIPAAAAALNPAAIGITELPAPLVAFLVITEDDFGICLYVLLLPPIISSISRTEFLISSTGVVGVVLDAVYPPDLL